MAEITLNKRQQYKSQKLQETDEIFYCECGKNYLTFSALYLHARNKHNCRFTTKRSPEVCKVETHQNRSLVTYFLTPHPLTQSSNLLSPHSTSEKVQNQGNRTVSYLQALQLLDLYLHQHRSLLNPAQLQILSHLKTYIQTLNKLLQIGHLDQIYDIPLCYNEFATFYVPLCCRTLVDFPEQMSLLQNCMIKYWFWLKSNNHTLTELLARSPLQNAPWN